MEDETTSLFHHELLKKTFKKSQIIKLDTEEGIIEGHEACAAIDLLTKPAKLEESAQEILLNEIDEVFTEKDNEILLARPTIVELKKTLSKANLHAAPGTDGIPSLLYNHHWDLMGPDTKNTVETSQLTGDLRWLPNLSVIF